MPQDPYIKLLFDYYDDVVIDALGDDGEVMFTRGLAYCGRAQTNGFIPRSKLLGLCRKSSLAQAVRLARRLTSKVGEFEGPWTEVEGGFFVRNFESIQHELITIQEKRKTDAARQRRKRAADKAAAGSEVSRKTSRDMSRDRPTNVTHPSKARVNTAAAVDAAGGDGLTAQVRIFRDKLRAVPAFREISFEVDQTQLNAIHDLVVLHGDDALIATAMRTAFHPAPAFATAFLKKWRALPAPGTALRLVDADRCDECGLTITACDKKSLTDPEYCPRKEAV